MLTSVCGAKVNRRHADRVHLYVTLQGLGQGIQLHVPSPGCSLLHIITVSCEGVALPVFQPLHRGQRQRKAWLAGTCIQTKIANRGSDPSFLLVAMCTRSRIKCQLCAIEQGATSKLHGLAIHDIRDRQLGAIICSASQVFWYGAQQHVHQLSSAPRHLVKEWLKVAGVRAHVACSRASQLLVARGAFSMIPSIARGSAVSPGFSLLMVAIFGAAALQLVAYGPVQAVPISLHTS